MSKMMNATHSSRFGATKYSESTKDKKEKLNLKIPVEKVYKTLNRQDFDLNVKNYWCEYRIKHPPIRRTNHVGFLFEDYYYIFGGRDINRKKMNDMYRFNLNLKDNQQESQQDTKKDTEQKWELVENTGDIPEPLAEHKGVLFNSYFYLFGGVNQSEEVSNNLYIYSIKDRQWIKNEYPENVVPPRTGHSMSLVGDKIVVFGGFDKGIFSNSIYIYDINEDSWDNDEKKEGDNELLKEGQETYEENTVDESIIKPDPRINHSQITVNTSILIYGGVDKDGKYFDDMWTYDLVTKYWKKIAINGEIPKARQGHSALLIDNDQMLIFGGKIGNIFEINEFWKFDLNTKRFSIIQGTLLQREGFTQQFKPKIIIETSTNHNPYQTFYKLKKVQIKTENDDNFNKTNGFNKNKEKNNPYEDIIMGDNKARNINNSLIYKIVPEDVNYINNLYECNKNLTFTRFKYGEVPLPRDGHTAFMYKGKMFIFGGDRNKYPFNDVYFFDFEKEKNDAENREKTISKKENSILDNESHHSQISKFNKKSEH